MTYKLPKIILFSANSKIHLNYWFLAHVLLFWNLFFTISASFISIIMGFVAGRFLKIDKSAIASLLFYLIAPIVFFNSVANLKFQASILAIPLIFMAFSLLISIATLIITKKFFWEDGTSNIMALMAGTANVGYFALPVAILVFDEEMLGVFIMCMLGINVFEVSIGFFIASLGNSNAAQSFKKVLKLPTIYAFAFGCVFSFVGLGIPDVFHNFMQDIRSCYVILGMMIIGFGLSEIDGFNLDFKFISCSFLLKFLIWPLMIFAFIFLDNQLFNLYSKQIHDVFILVSVVPLAANSVSIATILHQSPEKVASAILLSTVFAIFYVPLVVVFFVK